MDSLAADIWRQCEVGESLTLRRAEDTDREAEFAALVEREARFLIAQEWATKAEDILTRRTKHGLHLSASERADFEAWLASPEASAP